ncbi:A/B/D/E cyclin [Lipomyces japonicus]|uniref:A/B/D/E cyclin n=1 Tax=Lipomyces japonicus TaxID=56871 RepID=UPI0034CED1E4
MERQRSRPALRVRPDENSVVTRQSSRVPLKQLGGSTALADKTGLKAGAKRVVLGDVSNAVKSTSNAHANGKVNQVYKPTRSTKVLQQHDENSYDHHVAPNEIAEVYHRVRQAKLVQMHADIEADETADKVSEKLEIIEQEYDILADETKTSHTSQLLSTFDSTEYTNIKSRTNPSALFPVINDDTRKEYAWISSQYHQEEEIRATAPDYEGDEDVMDVSMVTEYSEEIFEYMRELELRFRPSPAYMDDQTEVHWSMRGILVDWLVQVHNRFMLLPETLYLTINYIDRFLSLKVVSLAKLQLVGATALFLAAKYEEINCPSVQELVYMVDHSYSAEEIFKAEKFMVGLLEFNLGWPGPMSFLRRTSKADDYDLETRTLAKYILEITIMDERFVGALPSWLAAAAHCLSRKMLAKGEWTTAHVYFSGYTLGQLRPAMNVLIECCRKAKEHHSSIYEKYCDRKYKKAALFVAEWINAVTV